MGGLVLLVANRLELEGAVRDVEVPTQAFPQPIQHLTGAALADARLVDETCADSTGTPLVIVQACRSCTSTTPCTRLIWSRTLARSTPCGVASSSTSTTSRSSDQARGTISTTITSEAMASNRSSR